MLKLFYLSKITSFEKSLKKKNLKISMIADSGKATRYKFNLTNNLYLNHLKEIFFYLKAFTRTKPTK